MELQMARLPGAQVSTVNVLLIFDGHEGEHSIQLHYLHIHVDRGAN